MTRADDLQAAHDPAPRGRSCDPDWSAQTGGCLRCVVRRRDRRGVVLLELGDLMSRADNLQAAHDTKFAMQIGSVWPGWDEWPHVQLQLAAVPDLLAVVRTLERIALDSERYAMTPAVELRLIARDALAAFEAGEVAARSVAFETDPTTRVTTTPDREEEF